MHKIREKSSLFFLPTNYTCGQPRTTLNVCGLEVRVTLLLFQSLFTPTTRHIVHVYKSRIWVTISDNELGHVCFSLLEWETYYSFKSVHQFCRLFFVGYYWKRVIIAWASRNTELASLCEFIAQRLEMRRISVIYGAPVFSYAWNLLNLIGTQIFKF